MNVPVPADPAVQIRDLVLPLLRGAGGLEDSDRKDSPLRLLVLDTGPWKFLHWTPFNALSAGEASSPGYRHALKRQRGAADMPYGLDILHHGDSVMSLIWSDTGAVDLLDFRRGEWEENLRIYIQNRSCL